MFSLGRKRKIKKGREKQKKSPLLLERGKKETKRKEFSFWNEQIT